MTQIQIENRNCLPIILEYRTNLICLYHSRSSYLCQKKPSWSCSILTSWRWIKMMTSKYCSNKMMNMWTKLGIVGGCDDHIWRPFECLNCLEKTNFIFLQRRSFQIWVKKQWGACLLHPYHLVSYLFICHLKICLPKKRNPNNQTFQFPPMA